MLVVNRFQSVREELLRTKCSVAVQLIQEWSEGKLWNPLGVRRGSTRRRTAEARFKNNGTPNTVARQGVVRCTPKGEYFRSIPIPIHLGGPRPT